MSVMRPWWFLRNSQPRRPGAKKLAIESLTFCFGILLAFSPPAFCSNLRDTTDSYDASCGPSDSNEISVNAAGFHYFKDGDFSSAIFCYRKAIKINPSFAVPYNNLGVIYLREGKHELAEEQFLEAVSIDGGYVKAILNAAIASYRLGKMKSAYELFKLANEVDPDYVAMRAAKYKNQMELR